MDKIDTDKKSESENTKKLKAILAQVNKCFEKLKEVEKRLLELDVEVETKDDNSDK